MLHKKSQNTKDPILEFYITKYLLNTCSYCRHINVEESLSLQLLLFVCDVTNIKKINCMYVYTNGKTISKTQTYCTILYKGAFDIGNVRLVSMAKLLAAHFGSKSGLPDGKKECRSDSC